MADHGTGTRCARQTSTVDDDLAACRSVIRLCRSRGRALRVELTQAPGEYGFARANGDTAYLTDGTDLTSMEIEKALCTATGSGGSGSPNARVGPAACMASIGRTGCCGGLAARPVATAGVRTWLHLLKAEIVTRIDKVIRQSGLKQTDAAKLLGLSQPDVSRLLRGSARE